MMSGVPFETFWAFNKLWNNKFYYKAAYCWYFYWIFHDARIHEYQIYKDQHCFDARFFCNLTFFCRGKLIPCHSRFVSGLKLKHQLFQTVTILRKKSRSSSTVPMKLRQHSTWLSLCSAVKGCGANFEKNCPFLKKFFPKFVWTFLTGSKTFSE